MTSRDPIAAARADAIRLADLLRAEHGAMAEFILALAAFDEARGWAELGHASLFDFLHRRLHLSKGVAYQRASAAALVRDHPAVAQALRTGRLCLSSVVELAKVLTIENEAAVLPRFFGLSAREAREVAAELAPHPSPPVREVVTAVTQVASSDPRTAARVLTSELALATTPREEAGSSPAPAAVAPIGSLAAQAPALRPASPRPADDAVPLTADLRRLHVTVSRRFLQKLEAARQARSHARPDATTEDLLEEALDLLLAREEKRRAATTERPAASPRPAGPDQIPARVRREVWARDEGRCQWPLDDGGTCGSTHRLQLDHAWPAARGGPPTAANLRILCERHNKEAARRTFGAPWMARFGAAGG